MGPKGLPDTKTYWLTVSSKVTSTDSYFDVTTLINVQPRILNALKCNKRVEPLK
jgi:hypothetical protein